MPNPLESQVVNQDILTNPTTFGGIAGGIFTVNQNDEFVTIEAAPDPTNNGNGDINTPPAGNGGILMGNGGYTANTPTHEQPDTTKKPLKKYLTETNIAIAILAIIAVFIGINTFKK